MEPTKDREQIPPEVKRILDKIHEQTGERHTVVFGKTSALERHSTEDQFKEIEILAIPQRDCIAESQGIQPEKVKLIAVKLYFELERKEEGNAEYIAGACAIMFKDKHAADLLKHEMP